MGEPLAWSQPTCGVAPICQVNENAKQDLKEGLLLYNTENNVGLKNAWNIIQAEVRLGSLHGVGRGKAWVPRLSGRTTPTGGVREYHGIVLGRGEEAYRRQYDLDTGVDRSKELQ